MAINSIILDIAERLKRNDQTLVHLDLNRLPLATVTDEEVALILEALSKNFVIRSICFFIPKSKDNVFNNYSFSNKASIEKVTVHSIPSLRAWHGLCSSLSGCLSLSELSIGQPRALINWNPMFEAQSISDDGENQVCSFEMMETMREILCTLPSLRKLCLRGFTVADGRPLAQGIRMSSLNELEIQQFCSSSGDDCWSELLDSIGGSSVEALTVIECEFKETACFEKLFARHCHAGPHSLRKLRVLSCDMKPSTIQNMLESVAISSLTLLDLRGNELNQTSCHQLSQVIERTSLRKLIVEECQLGDIGISVLAKGIISSSAMRKVNLRNNKITAIGCRALVSDLKQCKCPTLQTLDLSENFIGDEGALELSSLLQNFAPGLDSLVLEGCNISDQGIMALCKSLQDRPGMMTELRLGQNEIELQGACAVAELIASNAAIDSIDISSCSISDESAQVIAKALSDKCKIRKIGLAYNGIENTGASHWGKAIARSKHIKCLELQGNRFDVDGLESIVMGMAKNYSLQNINVWNLHCFSFRRRRKGLENADKSVRLVKMQKTLEYILRLNRGGRQATLHENLPEGLWPTILENAYRLSGPDTTFYLLKHGPLRNRMHFQS